jgi:choice-of-anchor A domain-containing protein
LAARNKVTLSGFTLGMGLNASSPVDGWHPFSLYVAGDASWTDGSLYPDGTNAGGAAAGAVVGGTFNAAPYLLSRQTNIVVPGLAAAFDSAQSYFTTIQSDLAGLGTNAVATIIYGDGLQITCSGAADLYHLTVSGSDFSGVNWYSTVGCKFSARWVIDITGTGSVSFQGQPFPGIVERVIYNVVGSGRTLLLTTELLATFLPLQTLTLKPKE